MDLSSVDKTLTTTNKFQNFLVVEHRHTRHGATDLVKQSCQQLLLSSKSINLVEEFRVVGAISTQCGAFEHRAECVNDGF